MAISKKPGGSGITEARSKRDPVKTVKTVKRPSTTATSARAKFVVVKSSAGRYQVLAPKHVSSEDLDAAVMSVAR